MRIVLLKHQNVPPLSPSRRWVAGKLHSASYLVSNVIQADTVPACPHTGPASQPASPWPPS
jgi:hypothetical protein